LAADLGWFFLDGAIRSPAYGVLASLAPRYIPTAEVACVKITEAVWAPIWIYFLEGEVPTDLGIIGGAMIFFSVLSHSALTLRNLNLTKAAAGDDATTNGAAQKQFQPPQQEQRVVVLGAGHAGCAISMMLAERGVDVLLIEGDEHISNGPCCHLHSFGAIYPDMKDVSDLPGKAVSFATSYPESVDRRPTLVALSPTAPYAPSEWHARIVESAALYEEWLDKLDDAQREVLIPKGAPVLEVLRSSVGAVGELSPWAVQTALHVPDGIRDAIMVWECGLNDCRLAALNELGLERLSHKIDLRAATWASDLVHEGDTWKLKLQRSGDVHQETISAEFVIDARGSHIDASLAPATAEFKMVFAAAHPTPCNVPEIVILDKRVNPGITQYTPYHFGSKLHKLQVGLCLFDCITSTPPAQDLNDRRLEEAFAPQRSLAAYEVSRGDLKLGTMPPAEQIKVLKPKARFQRLPASGGAEARNSYAIERLPGYIEVTLSKSVCAVKVAATVCSMVSAKVQGMSPTPAHCNEGIVSLQATSLLTHAEVNDRAAQIAARCEQPAPSAWKYDWDDLSRRDEHGEGDTLCSI